jgi:hypothetical protein
MPHALGAIVTPQRGGGVRMSALDPPDDVRSVIVTVISSASSFGDMFMLIDNAEVQAKTAFYCSEYSYSKIQRTKIFNKKIFFKKLI